MNAVAPVRQPTKLERFMGDVLPADQRSAFYAVLPRHISPEKFERALGLAVMANPDLMGCDPRLVFREVSKVVGLGLSLDPQLGEAYLILGWNGKTRQKEPQIRIGYKGIIKLAKQSGEILNIYAREVHEKDEIECVQGDENRLIHKPKLFTDRGPIVGYYAVVKYKSGEIDFEPMSLAQINEIRDRSDGYKAFAEGKIKSTPWSTDHGEMAKKTVLRRLSKRVSQSAELSDAISIEDRAEFSAFDRGRDEVPPPAPPRRQVQAQPAAPVIEHRQDEAVQILRAAEEAGAPDAIVAQARAVADAAGEDVVDKETLLADLDERLNLASTADEVEDGYTDFDAEALLSDYEGGVEAARALKEKHLDRVMARGALKPADPVDDFPANDAIAASDPFAVPERFKGGGHYQIWIGDAAQAAKTAEDENRLRLLWAQTKPQRAALVDEDQLTEGDVHRLLDTLKAAFARIQAAQPLAKDEPPAAPARASITQAQDGSEPAQAGEASAEEPEPASDDPVAAYTARLEAAFAAARTKDDVEKFWFATVQERDEETGATEEQRAKWRLARSKAKNALPDAEA